MGLHRIVIEAWTTEELARAICQATVDNAAALGASVKLGEVVSHPGEEDEVRVQIHRAP